MFDPHMPLEYFDGATQEDGYGGGVILHLTHKHSFNLFMGLRRGTNNSGELSAPLHIICFSLEKNFHVLQLFGDSKIP